MGYFGFNKILGSNHILEDKGEKSSVTENVPIKAIYLVALLM